MNPTRITVAFDQSTANLLEKINKEAKLSQSEIMRRALRFYYENKALADPAVYLTTLICFSLFRLYLKKARWFSLV